MHTASENNLCMSVGGQYGKQCYQPCGQVHAIREDPIYVAMVCASGKALVVEGYKSGKVNAIHYGKLGYDIGGYIGGFLGPIVGFSLERAVLSSIPAPVDGAFSLMTPWVKTMIGSTSITGMNVGLGTMGDSLK